jgi:hypothetical protein
MAEQPRIGVSDHAIARARGRLPAPLTRAAIQEEVRLGLAEGRWAHRQPRFLISEGRRRPRSARADKRNFRFVWPTCQSRAYVIARRPDGWSVVTVITRLPVSAFAGASS